MICGYCSREQNFRPEDCGTCHAILIGRKGSGFWEGGKGTYSHFIASKLDPVARSASPSGKQICPLDRHRLFPALPLDIPAAARHHGRIALASMCSTSFAALFRPMTTQRNRRRRGGARISGYVHPLPA
ncbi:uncharacterized protein BKA78DRAFT_156332 [Phyllosticta capitalensis]|uniref:uncharacterized protein n=1 Tax=Phyllosticta capitalensis TaxID=121624 RepID=UPI00312FD2C8